MLGTGLKRAQRALDKQLAPFHASKRTLPPPRGWIRAIREAIGMSGQQLADRLGVAWQSMDDLEKSEASGTITLNSLKKAADALDCRLVYALVPRKESLGEMVQERAREVARRALRRVDRTMLLEDQADMSGSEPERLQDYIDEHIRNSDLWAK